MLVDVGDHFKSDQKASDSGLSGCDVSPDHIQVVAGGFERLLGIMVRNKSGVIIKGCIALSAKTIKDASRPACFLSIRDRTKSMMAMWGPGCFSHGIHG